jgi:hypothetical protein
MPRKHNLNPEKTKNLSLELAGIQEDLAEMQERANLFFETKKLHARLVESAKRAYGNIRFVAQITPNQTMANRIIYDTEHKLLHTIREGMSALEEIILEHKSKQSRRRRGSSSSSSRGVHRKVQDACSVWDSIIDALAPYFVSSSTLFLKKYVFIRTID